MHKYEEERYLFKNIKNKIYPWIKERLVDYQALNGKYILPKDTPNVSVEDIYGIACENLVRDVKFVISNTMYGGFRKVNCKEIERKCLQCLKSLKLLF